MPEKRHQYFITSDKGRVSEKPLNYKFGGTPVELHLSKQGFVIRYERPGYTQDLLNDPLFRDAVKKAELVSYLKYGKRIDYRKVTATIDDDTRCIHERSSDKCLVYTMIANRLISPMASEWSDALIIQGLLDKTKSSCDRRDVALFTLLMAKSQDYESEKFMYLWMAMNALYGYIADIRWAGKGRKSESEKIRLMSKYYGLEYDAKNGSMKNVVRGKVTELIEKTDKGEWPDIFMSIRSNRWEGEFLGEAREAVRLISPDGNMDPYAFFLLWLPYQLRCNYFHGEKAIPIMSFADERPLPVLRFVNILLQRFLDEELYKWFNDDMRKEDMIPKVMELKL